MNSNFSTLFLLLVLPFIIIGQAPSQPVDFHSPLGIPLSLSSNFGAIRANHFHMGLDFKTNLKTGYHIYAVKEGFVSRIRISTNGYGKVIYIDHPNGLTSVYAHCSEFVGAIDSVVKRTQISEQNFTIEIFPEKGEIPVKRGEVIALSGNTGSSSGPHLHFEIRDTKTEHALNPLQFNFEIPDSKAPEIKGIRLYAVDQFGYRYVSKTLETTVIQAQGTYSVRNNSIEITSDFCSPNGGIGLAFDVTDKFDGSINQCGIYGSILIVDKDTVFRQEMDRIPFESARLVNSHTDYEAFESWRRDYHKSFHTAINDLPIYKTSINQGIIRVEPGRSYSVEYIAYDMKGNESRILFDVHVSVGPINDRPYVSDGEHYLEPDKPYSFQNDDCQLILPPKTVLEPQFFDEDRFCEDVFDSHEPVFMPYTIKLRNTYPNDGKSYIELKGSSLNGQYLKTSVEGDFLVADAKQFGSVRIARDEDIPRILPVNILSRTNVLSRNKLIWNISDVGSGIADYDLFIDGVWHLVEFEAKGNIITFQIPPDLKGMRSLVLKVKDNCNNVAEWSKTIEFI
jgi:hypothetical protein